LVPLTATQYTLVVALLRQRQRWLDSQNQEPVLLSVHHLQQLAHLPDPSHLDPTAVGYDSAASEDGWESVSLSQPG
jgi:hypothetical protein